MYPVCSFCGEQPVTAWLEGPHFRNAVDSADKVRAEEAWLACASCLARIDAKDREGLVERGTERLRRKDRDKGRQRSPREEPWMQQSTRGPPGQAVLGTSPGLSSAL